MVNTLYSLKGLCSHEAALSYAELVYTSLLYSLLKNLFKRGYPNLHKVTCSHEAILISTKELVHTRLPYSLPLKNLITREYAVTHTLSTRVSKFTENVSTRPRDYTVRICWLLIPWRNLIPHDVNAVWLVLTFSSENKTPTQWKRFGNCGAKFVSRTGMK